MRQFSAGSCYSYIIASQGEAIAIDPHISLLNQYRDYLRKNRLRLVGVIDTHTHADHFSLAAVLKKEFGVSVYMHEKAVSQVADRRVKDGDEIPLGGKRLKIFYTPGHTDDAVSVYVDGALATGDSILIGSVGRTDFQNGSPESMFDTIKKLKTFPVTTVVFPGHDYNDKKASTIGAELAHNPYFKWTDRSAFADSMRSKTLQKPFNMDNIIRVNRSGEASALEMISPREAAELAARDRRHKLLDVRSAGEYAEIHIKDSLNIPIDAILSRLEELGKSSGGYLVLCRTGNRAMMASDMLIQAGIKDVKVVAGGIDRWRSEKLPVEKLVGGISIERQVRIGAGSLVLFGLIMAWLFHPAFALISAFVGCGLIFAGVTDNCMMGMLLMKLPYNKRQYGVKTGGGTCAMGEW
jgi:glyoxylase-like metal-dependent hydrolase (beta-lactamase superfamily II)/rhodanese-related sulfurtransferase